MTTWGDHDRVEKIKYFVKRIRKHLASIDALCANMGSNVPDVTRSRAVGPLNVAVHHEPGVSGEGDE